MSRLKSFRLTVGAALVLGVSSVSADLIDRGNGLIYDDVLDITWLQDANYAKTSGFDADGLIFGWAAANAWAASLTFGGVSGWRLPNISPIDGVAFDYESRYDGSTDYGHSMSAPGTTYAGSTGSELAHLFYYSLGNLAFFDFFGGAAQPGWGLANTGPFINIQPNNYWTGTDYAPIADHAWVFTFNSGLQFNLIKPEGSYAWAVHDGDVGAPVPEPVAIDISPRRNRPCVNSAPVVIFGSADFDVTYIDVDTLMFGDEESATNHGPGRRCSLRDANSDGILDLVCRFIAGTGEATLSGELFDGTSFEGTDSICVVR